MKKGKTDYWDLPFELITEILSWLPAKSLVRFKCVSASWYQLIKDPKFIKLHLGRSLEAEPDTYLIESRKSKQSLYSFRTRSQHPYYHFTELTHPINIIERKNVQLIGSCNGILCFVTGSPRYNLSLFLYNPATRAVRRLPPVDSTVHIVLREVAFGYDSVSDDYKVLAFCEEHDEIVQTYLLYQKIVQKSLLYSLKTDSWENISNPPWYNLDSFVTYVRPAILAFNSFHWMNPSSQGIKCFDLFTQRYYEIPHPENNNDLSELTIFRGQLCIVTHTLNIWILKKHGKENSWTRIFHHLSGQLNNVDFTHPGKYNLRFGCSKDGHRIILAMRNYNGGLQKFLICCDLESKEAREIEVTNLLDDMTWILGIHPWVESLVPLN